MNAVIDMNDSRQQRRRIIVTVVVLGAVALMFYIAAFVRFW